MNDTLMSKDAVLKNNLGYLKKHMSHGHDRETADYLLKASRC